MTTTCPLCGQPADMPGLKVLVEEGAIFVGDERIRTTPMLLKYAKVLADAAGQALSKSVISQRIYGHQVPNMNVRQNLSKLRTLLAGTGYAVECIPHVGYRLRKTR